MSSGRERPQASRRQRTCHQCRVRKVRCDGAPDVCNNCQRLKFACSFSLPETESTSPNRDCPELQPGRRRGPRACRECRVQKTRCSGDEPACAACMRRGRPCVYLEPKRRLSVKTQMDPGPPSAKSLQPTTPGSPFLLSATDGSASTSTPIIARASNLPPPDEVLSLIQAFFRSVYPLIAYSFLHERSLVQRHQDGTLEETLAYTVCATSAMRLRQGKYHPLNTEGWVQQAEDIIWSQIEQPTIFRLQALILAIHYRIATGRFQRAFMLASLAARFASALRLNYEREDLGFLAQEIRRRLMWTLMTMDTFFSVGLPEFELCPYETIYLKLPSNEDDFNADFSQTTQSEAPGSVSVGSDTGLYAFAIRLTTLRRDVMRLKRQVTLSERPIPQLVKLVEDFRKSLLRVRSETPGSRLYALGEMEKFYSSRWRQRYLVAHLSWHQCNCDLYRLFLKGYPEAASNNVLQAVDPAYMSTAASLCLEHATSIIQIIYDFNQRSSDDEIVEHDVAVCAYHAARIVAYTANPEWDPQQSLREAVLGQATLCLAFLRRFFSDSPLVTYMITDLEKIIRGSSGTGDRSGSAESSESEENGVGHIPRLSRVARDTQRLGVHSVVRQSRFVDDSGECTTPTTTPGTAPFRRQFSSPGASTVSDRMAQPSLVPGQGSISHATAFPTGNQWDPSWSIGLDLLGDGFESHNIDFGLDRAWSNLQPSWPGNGPAADPEFF